MHCHGNSVMLPPCYLPWILPVHSGRHVGQVRCSCTKLVFPGNVVSCICRECIGKVINFKWLSENINADTSNLIGKAKFVVTVVGPMTLLSIDAALESRVPEQSPGSGNTNVTIAIANLCHSLTSHHACTSAAAYEKLWVAQWTTQMVPWVVRNNFGLSDIKKKSETKSVYFDNQTFGHGLWQENFSIRQSDL